MISRALKVPLTIDERPGGYVLGLVLGYDVADPYAVSLTFADDASTRWVISRDLIADALRSNQSRGDGDIRVMPLADWVHIRLSAPAGTCRIAMRSSVLAEFLDATFAAVPAGAETLDLDDFLAGVLGGAS